MMEEEAHINRAVFGFRDIGEKQADISPNKSVVLNTHFSDVSYLTESDEQVTSQFKKYFPASRFEKFVTSHCLH